MVAGLCLGEQVFFSKNTTVPWYFCETFQKSFVECKKLLHLGRYMLRASHDAEISATAGELGLCRAPGMSQLIADWRDRQVEPEEYLPVMPVCEKSGT